MSERVKILVRKDANKLEMSELAFLIRERIGTLICIPIAVKKLKEAEINLSFLHRNNEAEEQRELIRELILLDNWYWDRNSNAHSQLKKILGIKIDYLNLPTSIKEEFKNYELKELLWNEKSTQNFKAYMNDTRMGVVVGYGMVTSLKRAILNGNSVKYEIGGESTIIQSIDKFNKLIVDKLDCNDELLELLNKENKMEE